MAGIFSSYLEGKQLAADRKASEKQAQLAQMKINDYNDPIAKRARMFEVMKVEEKARQDIMVQDAKTAKALLTNGNTQDAMTFLADRAQAISELGGDARETLDPYNAIRAGQPQQAIQMIDNFLSIAEGADDGSMPAPVQTFNQMVKTAGLTNEQARDAALINLGLKPRAVGSSMQTIANDPNKLNAVAAAEAVITGRREEAKLIQQMQLEPQIQAAVTSSVAKASNLAKQAQESRSNESAWNVYKTGMGGLVSALGDTNTGSIIGIMPALTSNQKIADGAIAIMRPIIKDVVRSAGEGTFTDQDQKLIDMMIPSRTDDPTAAQAKVSMLDNFIKAKLKIDQGASLFEQQNQSSLTPEEEAELRALEAEFGN